LAVAGGAAAPVEITTTVIRADRSARVSGARSDVVRMQVDAERRMGPPGLIPRLAPGWRMNNKSARDADVMR